MRAQLALGRVVALGSWLGARGALPEPIDLATLACGRFDGFYEAPMEAWDKAAGVLIVREAGGVVSELPAPKGLSPGVVAAKTASPSCLSVVTQYEFFSVQPLRSLCLCG